MGEWTDDEKQAWLVLKGDEQIPGSADPQEGKCGSRLRNKAIRAMEDLLALRRGTSIPRFCTIPAGAGTDHLGYGPCDFHLGKTPNIMTRYMPVAMKAELTKLADAYDEEIGLDPAPIEAARILLRNKRMFLALERMVQQIEGMELTTDGGRSADQLKPIFTLWIEVNKILTQWIQFALKFDLENRRLELEANQARDIIGVVLSVIMDPTLQLTNEQTTNIRLNLVEAMQKISPNLRPDWAAEFDYDIDAEEDE